MQKSASKIEESTELDEITFEKNVAFGPGEAHNIDSSQSPNCKTNDSIDVSRPVWASSNVKVSA